MTEIGRIEALFRYPVKSMAGERLDEAQLGFHGVAGDRRLALRRKRANTGFPWLTASRLSELVLFTPLRREPNPFELATHVRTPEGRELEVFGDELAADIERRHGEPVEMMFLKNGIFDDAGVSIITDETVREVTAGAGVGAEVRRFRPNLLVRPTESRPYQEGDWVGGTLVFGDADDAPRVSVTLRDVRCSVINVDPDSAERNPEVLKTVARANDTVAGVYGTVVRKGALAVGQPIRFIPSGDDR